MREEMISTICQGYKMVLDNVDYPTPSEPSSASSGVDEDFCTEGILMRGRHSTDSRPRGRMDHLSTWVISVFQPPALAAFRSLSRSKVLGYTGASLSFSDASLRNVAFLLFVLPSRCFFFFNFSSYFYFLFSFFFFCFHRRAILSLCDCSLACSPREYTPASFEFLSHYKAPHHHKDEGHAPAGRVNRCPFVNPVSRLSSFGSYERPHRTRM